jgi:hypothetical protein
VFSFTGEALLHDIRARWPNALLHVRAERTYDQVATDIESGRADIAAVAAWGPQPDFIKRLRTDAPLNDPIPQHFAPAGRTAVAISPP